MKRECTAHRTNGQPCHAPAIKGGAVCYKHGGAAPQVKEAARRRLLMLVDPALGVLDEALRQKEDRRAGIDAAKDVLNRAGLKTPEQIEVSGKDGEPLFDLSNVPVDQLELIVTILKTAQKPGEPTEEDS